MSDAGRRGRIAVTIPDDLVPPEIRDAPLPPLVPVRSPDPPPPLADPRAAVRSGSIHSSRSIPAVASAPGAVAVSAASSPLTSVTPPVASRRSMRSLPVA